MLDIFDVQFSPMLYGHGYTADMQVELHNQEKGSIIMLGFGKKNFQNEGRTSEGPEALGPAIPMVKVNTRRSSHDCRIVTRASVGGW